MLHLFRARLFKLDIAGYRFSPGILPTFVTLFMLYVMISLGQWQAGKADYKLDLQTKIAERRDLPPVSMDVAGGSIDERLYRPVEVWGEYQNDRIILHDNRILDMIVGYDVYTPLIMPDGRNVLINRGFVPQGRTREDIPPISTVPGNASVHGLLDRYPSRGVILAEDIHDYASWPVVVQYVDNHEIAQAIGAPVYDMIIRLDSKDGAIGDDGLRRVIPALKLDAAKNTGYAFQWYAMSLALVIIYIVVNTKRR